MSAQPPSAVAAGPSDTLLTRSDLNLRGEALAPQNDVERALLRLWGDVLEVEGLGVNDNFFAAGGDSLAAAALCTGVERDLGVVIPVSVLLSAATPRLFAKKVEATRAKREQSCLVLLRKGHGPAAAFVHGMFGDIGLAGKFSSLLDDGRRIYGLRGSGLAEGEPLIGTVPEIAAHYLEALLRAEPNGPYLLGGYCGGNLIAFEMAQQLSARGADIPGLMLLDPPIRQPYVPWMYGQGPIPIPDPITLSEEGLKAEAAGEEGERRRWLVHAVNSAALGAYVPKPWSGRVHVVHCQRRGRLTRDPQRGYPSLVTGKLTFSTIGWDHDSIFSESMDDTVRVVQAFMGRVAPVVRPGAAKTAR
jgi:pimeloyl-ACP methyl ester carboxylesterase